MQRLSKHRLPMPKNESQFHAARIYMDDVGRSVYCVEQWVDYIRCYVCNLEAQLFPLSLSLLSRFFSLSPLSLLSLSL